MRYNAYRADRTRHPSGFCLRTLALRGLHEHNAAQCRHRSLYQQSLSSSPRAPQNCEPGHSRGPTTRSVPHIPRLELGVLSWPALDVEQPGEEMAVRCSASRRWHAHSVEGVPSGTLGTSLVRAYACGLLGLRTMQTLGVRCSVVSPAHQVYGARANIGSFYRISSS